MIARLARSPRVQRWLAPVAEYVTAAAREQEEAMVAALAQWNASIDAVLDAPVPAAA